MYVYKSNICMYTSIIYKYVYIYTHIFYVFCIYISIYTYTYIYIYVYECVCVSFASPVPARPEGGSTERLGKYCPPSGSVRLSCACLPTTIPQRGSTLPTTSPQRGSKSSFSNALNCTTRRRVPARAIRNQGPGKLNRAVRAGWNGGGSS